MRDKSEKKTDGYIKNQKIRLREMRLTVFLKILCAIVPLAILLTCFWGIMSLDSTPEKWEEKQIVFSHISRESPGRRGTYVLYTTDGERYVIGKNKEMLELLQNELVPYREYTIIYSESILSRIAKSLSSSDSEFIELDRSVAKWESQQKIFHIVCVVMICMMLIGAVLSYLFWCKKEFREIKMIKSKISERLSKRQGRE